MIKKIFKKFDVFAPKVELRFEKKKVYKTYIGGIVTLLIFGLVFAYFYNIASKMVNRTNY